MLTGSPCGIWRYWRGLIWGFYKLRRGQEGWLILPHVKLHDSFEVELCARWWIKIYLHSFTRSNPVWPAPFAEGSRKSLTELMVSMLRRLADNKESLDVSEQWSQLDQSHCRMDQACIGRRSAGTLKFLQAEILVNGENWRSWLY